MRDVRTEDDLDRLRQMAVLLDGENARLHKEIQKLASEVAELRGLTTGQAQQLLEGVVAKLDAGGSKPHKTSASERRGRRRRKNKDAPKKRTEFGPTEQPALELEETTVSLPADKCTCGDCGLPLKEMVGGFEQSEFIDVISRKFVLHRTKRQKYAKTCACSNPVVTTPHEQSPDTLGGRYSVGFCATVAEAKYLDHQPLNRQARQMGRDGLEVTSQSLFSCLWLLCLRATATYEALQQDVLSVNVIHIDETGWRSMDVTDATRELWGMSSDRGAYYRILTNRSHEGARTMLGDFGGWVMTDGLKVYDKATRLHGYLHCGCWAHARRYLVECEADFPVVTEPLDWIDELFAIEREIDEVHVADPFGYRAATRDVRSRPLIAKLYSWLTTGKPPPGTALETAVSYVHGQWAKLKLFVDHPEIPLSNNAAERALRCAVIGRNNFRGTRSKRGELVAAIMYSILETARLRGIDGRDYLMAIARHDLAEDSREREATGTFVRRPLLPDEYLRTIAEAQTA
ncbi:MAG: IS66 family transposase [bacterium]|nr:IS66 family transposase [bacterium]